MCIGIVYLFFQNVNKYVLTITCSFLFYFQKPPPENVQITLQRLRSATIRRWPRDEFSAGMCTYDYFFSHALYNMYIVVLTRSLGIKKRLWTYYIQSVLLPIYLYIEECWSFNTYITNSESGLQKWFFFRFLLVFHILIRFSSRRVMAIWKRPLYYILFF